MNRRHVLSGIAGLLSLPFLPASATARASASVAPHLATASMLVRCHDHASPQMLARLMRLDAATADRLFHHLIDRQVIAPTASGVARAIQPLNTRCVTNEARHARQVLRFARDLHDRLRRMASSRADAQGEGDIPSHEDAHPNPPNDDLSHSP